MDLPEPVASTVPRTWGIVLAAGGGSRFGGPKQFRSAGGRRLVDLALATTTAVCDATVLVVPSDRTWDGAEVDVVVAGGVDRGGSVRRGLAAIPDEDGIVLVHQAANPLASVALCRTLLDAVRGGADAAAPGLRPVDLVRRAAGTRFGEVVGRDDLVLVQTPAAFRLPVLRKAHGSSADAVEDTALVTSIGHEIVIGPGDPQDMHVATPQDLARHGPPRLQQRVASTRHRGDHDLIRDHPREGSIGGPRRPLDVALQEGPGPARRTARPCVCRDGRQTADGAPADPRVRFPDAEGNYDSLCPLFIAGVRADGTQELISSGWAMA